MPAERPTAITKEMSRNDSGETGGHQAGILIPKDDCILAFFPELNPREKNPRHHIVFLDPVGERWTFAFIYYNNRFFGGTRNEYRLTCMTPFIRSHNLKAGDRLTLHRVGHAYRITYRRVGEQEASGILKLGTTWKVVPIR
jgi:hypothetical protein